MKVIATLATIVLFALPATVFAQFNYGGESIGASQLSEVITLDSDGAITVDGERSKRAKLDVLADKYVLRYKVVDRPSQILSQVSVTLRLPDTVTAEEVQPAIYAIHGVGSSDYEIVDLSTIRYNAYNISPDATITITASIPQSAIQPNLWLRARTLIRVISFEQWLAIAILVPAAMFIFALVLFVQRYQDIYLRPDNLSVFDPPSTLPPALVGVLLTGYVGMREIAATLIDLARRGYIDIIYRGDGEFAFSRKRQWADDKAILSYERYFLNQIFTEGVISESTQIKQNLNYKIWSEQISQAIDDMYQTMTKLGYFKENPKNSHLRIRFLGIINFFGSALGFGVSALFFNEQPLIVIPWIFSMISSPILLRLSLLVPHRTDAGREQARKWLAFRNYLAQPNPILYTDVQDSYEKYLAYAIAMGVEGPWTARFTNLPARIPDWFYAEKSLMSSYVGMAEALFAIISYVGEKFSYSRKPNTI